MIGLNTVLAVAAALGLVVMANYLAGGHFERYQWSRDAAFKLSEPTVRVLDNLTNDVNVTIFFQASGQNPEIYELTKALLAEYQHVNPRRIHVKNLDYTRLVGAAKELLATNSLVGLQEKDFVLFQCGGRSKIVFARDLADYDFSDLLAGRSQYVRRSAFRGEMYFTADIYAVSYPQTLKTYFLYGHGENNPGDPHGGDSKLGQTGYSTMASIVKNEITSDWDRLLLQGTNGIPADCQLLIIAAGAHEGKILPEELDKISTYLKQGGRLLALLTVDCGLEPVLKQWGVIVGPYRVVDTDPKYYVENHTFYSANWVPGHIIVNPLASEKQSLLMVWPRPVFKVTPEGKVPGAPEVSYLALTSTNGVDEKNRRGEYPLLAAVEQGVISGVSSPHAGGTRIVVAGDSDFLDDTVIQLGGNHYFAARALNWLLDRPQLLLEGLGPKPITEYRLYMSRSQTRKVQWLFLAAMPGAVLALGALVWLRRRS
ncbi:MAG TPA: Gldg family protein [Verrucomicrobiae bacterium]|nr:Gldg family protein [Verrucomicrobiae bacterium]